MPCRSRPCPRQSQPVLYHQHRSGDSVEWELFEVGFDFFVDRSIADVIGRPATLHSMGNRPSRNRPLTEAEFVELLSRGGEIREQVYATGTWPDP